MERLFVNMSKSLLSLGILILLMLISFDAAPTLFALESGLPLSRYFNVNQYGAHNQNWAIAQDSSGVMFFGNNSGILRFDGSVWQKYPTPKGGIVRSLALGSANKIYAGAYAEFGYLKSDAFGRLRWISLSDSLPSEIRVFFGRLENSRYSARDFFHQSPVCFSFQPGRPFYRVLETGASVPFFVLASEPFHRAG